MMEKKESPNKYLVITIKDDPEYELKDEAFIENKIVKRGPIYHNWIKDEKHGIIGIKISSWMISTLHLSKKEKEAIDFWGRQESDLEVYFGNYNESNKNSVSEDMVSYTTIIQLNVHQRGISFPLFGTPTLKKDLEQLESNLVLWKSK